MIRPLGSTTSSLKYRNAWSPRRTLLLQALVDQGLSGSQIAKILGLTRSTISGKAKRLGLRLKGGIVPLSMKKRKQP